MYLDYYFVFSVSVVEPVEENLDSSQALRIIYVGNHCGDLALLKQRAELERNLNR